MAASKSTSNKTVKIIFPPDPVFVILLFVTSFLYLLEIIIFKNNSSIIMYNQTRQHQINLETNIKLRHQTSTFLQHTSVDQCVNYCLWLTNRQNRSWLSKYSRFFKKAWQMIGVSLLLSSIYIAQYITFYYIAKPSTTN